MLFVGIVGRSSDAKGDTWGVALWPFQKAEPTWASNCIANGVGSGEGLIERIADAQQVMDKEGKAIVIPGASDKRCLLRLSELSRCFKLGRRENATLSEHLREAWDGEPVHVPNRKGNAISTSGYAISLIGDITPMVLAKMLGGGTEAFDGFANRFLWCCVRSSQSLPHGGDIGVLDPFLVPLAEARAFGKTAGELRRTAEAEALWEDVYSALKRSGDSVPHTDRARPYVVRLSLLYAILDKAKAIGIEHMQAALALWDYCKASARYLFAQGEPKAEALWLRLLNAIQESPGIKRHVLTERFKHEAKAEGIGEALANLERQRLAHCCQCDGDGPGRRAECWFPVPRPSGDGEGDRLSDDSTIRPHADLIADASGFGSCSGDARKENNSALGEGNSFPSARQENNSPEQGPEPRELFSFAGETPEAETASQEKEEASGAVKQFPEAEASTFAHEAEGGLGVSGEPSVRYDGKPLPKSRWHELLPKATPEQSPTLERMAEVNAWWDSMDTWEGLMDR